MAISGKDIQDCMLEFARISLAFSLTCVKNHPFVASTLTFLLFLYVCFSWLFWLIIYLASFFSLAASVAKIYFSVRNAKIFKGFNEKNNDLKSFSTRRLVRNDANARSVRRRRSKEPFRDESLETSEEERSTGFSSSINNVVTVDKTALIEEYPKEIREVQVDSVTRSRGEGPTLKSLKRWRAKRAGHGKGDRESESSESTEDDECDKKAVQWSEDDQKNLMDLGLSEIERNKRLESLIARRRARKLLSLQVRRTLMNMDRNEPYARVNPIVVPKNHHFPGNHSPGQFSPVPGSAPSVLIPRDNPFDLPYDPHEEKPILTGGSFHQDFLPVLQKDMFCRHESFSLGPFFPGEIDEDDQGEAPRFHFQDIASKQRSFESWGDSKLENQLDRKDVDKIIEVESSQPPEPESEFDKDYVDDQDAQSPEPRMDSNSSHQEENNEEVQTKMMLIDDSSGHPSSASSSELDEPYSRLDKTTILESLAPRLQRNISAKRDSRSETDQDTADPGPSTLLDKDKVKDRPFWTHKGMHHKPSFSIASDLQVEVSEISSPPLTFDGSFSSYDEEGNMERGVICSGEDRWAPSPPMSDGDENELRLRDIHEVTENNPIEIGFSGTPNPKDPVGKLEINEEMIEDVGTSLRSQSNSATDLTNLNENQTTNPNSRVEEKFQMSTGSSSSHEIPSKPPAYPASRLTAEQIAQRPNSDPDRPEFSRSLDNLQGEFRSEYNANYSNFLQRLNTNNLVIDEKDAGSDSLLREGGRPQKDWSMTSSPTSIGYPESQFDQIEEHRNMFEYYQPAGENHNPSNSDDFGEESISLPQQETMDDSIPVDQEQNLQESIPDDDDEQPDQRITTDDQVYPAVSESLRSRRVAELLPHLIVQQLPFASIPTSSPSPRSVLQPKFSIDQRTLSNFSEDMHAEIQHFNEQVAENDAPQEPSGDLFIYNYQTQNTTSTEETKITESASEPTQGNTESLTIPESTAVPPETEEASCRVPEENDEMTKKILEEEPARENIESSGSNNTEIQLIPEEEKGYRISEQKYESELEKQQLPKPDYETKSGFNEHFQSVSGINNTDEVKEVDPGVKGAEEISPENHIAGLMTQEITESSSLEGD
ncbi:OLC1v1006179C1 [Oldenlandia corymbosa var. corymbosa]|uniref:OLC1v1006179C1 n=1 Tax=Oldenlandia corymbosa var. corymbosa TaxID=529605 RepID=A0AAV1DGG6_OLDCO|nr:OLC1v1006179C1 [Oldenlandia corymbosa var. corymbosa]